MTFNTKMKISMGNKMATLEYSIVKFSGEQSDTVNQLITFEILKRSFYECPYKKKKLETQR